jgi:ribonuclease Z
MEVIILGTSSAAPTLRRALSATAIVREGEVLLFDCGEGTQFRFLQAGIKRRKFGRIFITHLHGDHVFGLFGLFATMNLGGRTEPLEVYGPVGLKRLVDFFMSFPRNVRLGFVVHVHEMKADFTGVVVDDEEYQVLTLPLDHTISTFGYRLQEKDRPGRFDAEKADAIGVPFGPERGQLQRGESVRLADGRTVKPADLIGPPRPGKSVVYCTDTAFCVNAKRLAEGADLLIHEATYGEEFLELAMDRKHSTIRHAATVAKNAKVKRFVATHFSTRYDNDLLRKLEEEGRSVYPDLIMARDLLRIEV